jgi:DHA3 family macrolide efflux protein-like MFS transporter
MQVAARLPRRWQVPFFTIWTGQALSLVGSNVASFALVWWLTETTGSATVLATASLVALLPGIILGPVAGACVDRWNRRLVMIVADSFVALVSAWLAWLFWAGAMQPWHVYVIMLARGIGGAFHWPAMEASTSLMVPKEHLSRVAGLNQMVRGAMNVVAPPAGAFLIALLPLHGIMGIDVATALVAVLPLAVVYIPQPPRVSSPARSGEAGTTIRQDLVAGLRYVWGWPGLRAIILMAVLLNLTGSPAFSLIPILVTQHFGGQALELGWMNSGWGLGIVLGGLALSTWGGFRRRVLTSLAGLVIMGVATVAIGLAPAEAFWLALAGIAVGGVMNPMINGPLMALVQATVAPDMQGRVFTLIGSLCMAASPLGLAVAGPLADRFGVRPLFIVDGVVCLAMGVVGFFVPAIVHMEDGRTASESRATSSSRRLLRKKCSQ